MTDIRQSIHLCMKLKNNPTQCRYTMIKVMIYYS